LNPFAHGGDLKALSVALEDKIRKKYAAGCGGNGDLT
jgi:hypothetical protein